MTLKENLDKIIEIDQKISNGIRGLRVVNLSGYKILKKKRQDEVRQIQAKGYK